MTSQPLVVTVTIPPDILEPVILAAARAELRVGQYNGDRNGAGYDAILRQVRAHLTGYDYAPLIEQIAARMIAPTVEQIISAQVERQVKAALKTRKESA